MIEKPFGTDLATGHELNEQVHRVFAEHQVYRIDHYLGKETVQNILVLRFANSIFEPIWNRNHIDHVQITAAEDLTVGHRAAYYDSVGVLRDMFQNHLMQLMTLTAMEAPTRFEADTVRDEKVKVLRAVRIMKPEEVATDTVRAQYRKYRDEPGVQARQRDGHLRRRQAAHRQLAVAGRAVPAPQRQGHVLPQHADRDPVPPAAAHDVRGRAADAVRGQPAGHPGAAGRGHPFALPDEGARRRHEAPHDRAGLQLPRASSAAECPRPTSGCCLDVMHGDASLFTRADEVELAWAIIDPIRRGWESPGWPPLTLLRGRRLGPAQRGRMDVPPIPRMVRRLPGAEVG